MNKLLIFIAISLFANSAFASCNSTSCYTTIKRIYASGLADKTVFIEPNDSPAGIVNCTLSEGTYFTLKESHPLYSEIYSLSLAALMAKNQVLLRIVENSSDCELGYAMVYAQ